MDGLELLKEDHARVAELFEQAEGTENDKQKQKIFEQIAMELEIHTSIEEQYFYPELEKHEDFKDITLEAYEEHKQAKTLIRELKALVDGSEKFDAKLKVLQEDIEHHVEEEEEEMFPQVRKAFSKDQIEAWGEQFAAAKLEYGKQYKTKSSSK